jgi:hypothetical protein
MSNRTILRVCFVALCSMFGLSVLAQTSKHDDTDIYTIMSLENQALKKKLTNEINKTDVSAATTSVPAILPMSAAAPVIVPMSKPMRSGTGAPYTTAVYGIKPDYRADISVSGILYSSMRAGSMAGAYRVASVTAQGASLELTVSSNKRRGKGKAVTNAETKTVFAPLRTN